MATDPGDFEKAFRNIDLFTADHMISSVRPQLREGVLEAKSTLEKELSKLKAENEELEKKLMEKIGTARLPGIIEAKTEKTNVKEMETRKEPTTITKTGTEKPKGIQKPPGPIEIGRPYPVYIICHKCGTRVLTQVERDSDEAGCCGFTSGDDTMLHSCPLCGALVGIYKKT